MTVTTRQQQARRTSELDNTYSDNMADNTVADNMADNIVSTQKAYNRAIDAPTVVKPSVAATILAINQLNILALCSPSVSYRQFPQ